MQIFDDAAVRRHLAILPLIDGMAEALKALSTSNSGIVQPLRTVHEVPGFHGGSAGLLFMKPVFTPEVIATKLITQMPDNATRGAPTMLATLLIMDRQTGAPLAVLDATWLTNLRTAAVSAVMARAWLAMRSSKSPIKVAILGSGALARTHALALHAVTEIAETRIWSRSSANREACASDVAGVPCDSAQAAVDGADLIVTVTTSATPVLQGAWLKPGALVCAIGAPRPTWRELDDAAMHAGIVIADRADSAREEAGDIRLSGATVFAEIGEILLGKKTLPPDTNIVFKALGQAVEDAVAAQLVIQSHSHSESAHA